jgi:hypothetical protein
MSTRGALRNWRALRLFRAVIIFLEWTREGRVSTP